MQHEQAMDRAKQVWANSIRLTVKGRDRLLQDPHIVRLREQTQGQTNKLLEHPRVKYLQAQKEQMMKDPRIKQLQAHKERMLKDPRVIEFQQKHLKYWRTRILLPVLLFLSVWNVISASTTPSNAEVSDRTTDLAQNLPTISTIIDVISVGSLLKQDYQDAQERTFGNSHVRNFYRITERNDTDHTCYTDLTTDQLEKIIDFCANTQDESYISTTLRKRLFEPKKHTGWMCAQKRPLDGLYQVMQQYKRKEHEIPDYLFVIDDDTYVDMDIMTKDLRHYFPVDRPALVAGCNFEFLKDSGITFPYGGFGTYLTKATIQKILQPIYCDGRDEHSHLGCWRLNLNALGERNFFEEGMNAVELMQNYAAQLPYTKVEEWNKEGYCLHSDHSLAYFLSFYHTAVPEGHMKANGIDQPKDKIRRRHSYAQLPGGNGTDCSHEKENCAVGNRVCHYQTPSQMDALYEKAHAAGKRQTRF